jgi:competence ComEA-like helix-hairpin-helix protein
MTLAAAVTALLGTASVAHAQQDAPVKALTIQPSRIARVAKVGLRLGPIALTNTTQTAYTVGVFPVLLDQTFAGAVIVDDAHAAKVVARRLIAIQNPHFDLAPGRAASTLAAIKRVTAGHYVYGGVLFSATPRQGASSSQPIEQILRLNSSLFLDPPPPLRRLDFRVRPTYAQQAGPRRLRLITAVTNRGNYYAPASGRLFLRDLRGRLLAKMDLNRLKILPGKDVGLQALLAEPVLPAGVYIVNGLVRSGAHRFKSSSRIRLYGPNTVRSENARFVDFASPRAERGKPVDVTATFRNTGNIRFAPRAKLEITPLDPKGVAGSTRVVPMRAQIVDPGRVGEVTARIDPGSARAVDLTARLIVNGQVVDERSVGISFVAHRSAWQRFRDWLSDHALLLLALVLLALIAVALVARRAARDRRGTPWDGDGRVDLNSAAAEDLARLPGIGPKAAERIVAHRDEYGAFVAVAGLEEVEGFDAERVAGLRDSLDARPPI